MSELQVISRKNLILQAAFLSGAVLFLTFTIVYAMWTITNNQTVKMDQQRAERLSKKEKLDSAHYVKVERWLQQIKQHDGITDP